MRGCVSIPAFRFLSILVFVCDHSFMLFRKCTLNSSISLCHSSFYVFHTFSFRRNRVMNGQNHAVAMYPFACTWQDFKRTVDCDGNNCQLQVICQLKRPFLKYPMCPVKVRAPSGKTTKDTPSFSESFACRMVSSTFWDRTGLQKCVLHFHMLFLQMVSYAGFFHHPLEISSDESINKKNIEGPLMIRHKDIRGLPV